MSVSPVPAAWQPVAGFLDNGLVITTLILTGSPTPVVLIDPDDADAEALQHPELQVRKMSLPKQIDLADALDELGIAQDFVPGLSGSMARKELKLRERRKAEHGTDASVQLPDGWLLPAAAAFAGAAIGHTWFGADPSMMAELIGATLGVTSGYTIHRWVTRRLKDKRRTRAAAYRKALSRTRWIEPTTELPTQIVIAKLKAAQRAMKEISGLGLSVENRREQIIYALGQLIRTSAQVRTLHEQLHEATSIVYAAGDLSDPDVQHVAADADRLQAELVRKQRSMRKAARELFEATRGVEEEASTARARLAAAAYRSKRL